MTTPPPQERIDKEKTCQNQLWFVYIIIGVCFHTGILSLLALGSVKFVFIWHTHCEDSVTEFQPSVGYSSSLGNIGSVCLICVYVRILRQFVYSHQKGPTAVSMYYNKKEQQCSTEKHNHDFTLGIPLVAVWCSTRQCNEEICRKTHQIKLIIIISTKFHQHQSTNRANNNQHHHQYVCWENAAEYTHPL